MPQIGKARKITLDVVRRLREERLARKWSAYRLAKNSGVSQQMIGYMEKGLRNPTLETLLRIALALEVDLSKLLKRARRTIDS